MLRSLAEKFGVSIFDRVTEIEFHRYSKVHEFDLTVFQDLEKVSKPLEYVAFPTTTNDKELLRKQYDAEMDRQASLQATAALENSFSSCQIANVEKDSQMWRADIAPGSISCCSLNSR